MKIYPVVFFSLIWIGVLGPSAHSAPATCAGGELVPHTYYEICYSEPHEQALWTYHKLDRAKTRGPASRGNNFRRDPAVSTGSAGPKDYSGSGYDRGHLVPAGDMKLNETAMSETFFMSNMSPQVPGFNRGIWNRIEDQVRRWVQTYDEIEVFTGPVLSADLPKLPSGVSIPETYYKIVYYHDSTRSKMAAFLIQNESSSAELKSFLVPVDRVEAVSGVDFFAELPDAEEAALESKVDFKFWSTE